MEKQWFYLESYVFVDIKDDEVLVYNTLDGSYIVSSNDRIISLMQKMQSDKSGVVLIQYIYLDDTVKEFISSIRLKYMGDIINVSLSEYKPIQIYPILNLQSDLNKLKQNLSCEAVDAALSYLESVTFCVNSFCTLNCSFCSYAHKQFSMCTTHFCSGEFDFAEIVRIVQDKSLTNLNNISITGGNIFNYSDYKLLVSLLGNSNKHVDWLFHYKNVFSSVSNLPSADNFSIRIVVDASVDLVEFEWICVELKKRSLDYYFYLLIQSEADYDFFDNTILNKIESFKYNFVLLYNSSNLYFFEKCGYSITDDILRDKLSLREIYSHQVLNRNDFGKLIIYPNGDVFANVNMPKIGNISKNSICEIISKEMFEGGSWLRIRNNKLCKSCIYQWLCPSPSNYELVLGRSNLCHVK